MPALPLAAGSPPEAPLPAADAVPARPTGNAVPVLPALPFAAGSAADGVPALPFAAASPATDVAPVLPASPLAAGPAAVVAVPAPPREVPVAPGPRRDAWRGRQARGGGRPPNWTLVTLAVVLVVVGVGALRAGVGGRCDGATRVTVAADPAVASAVTAAGRRLDGDDNCLDVRVDAVVSDAMAGDAAGSTRADVYIPDSSLWLALNVAAKGRTVGSAARSPVVLARRPGVAPVTDWTDLRPARDGTAPVLRVLDPMRDASGLAALLLTRRAVGATPAEPGAFSEIMRGGVVADDAESAFRGLDAGSVVAVSEQAVWRRVRQGGGVSAVIPADAVSLDFPVIVADDRKASAARALLAALRTPEGKAQLARIGLRPADGAPARGVSDVLGLGAAPAGNGAGDAPTVVQTLEMWRKMRLGTRMLTVLDVSGSMTQQVKGTRRARMDVTSGELEQGLALLPDDAEVGLWAFATALDGEKPYREVVPLRRLGSVQAGGTQRAGLQQALTSLRPKKDGDTGLYDSVLAAVRAVRAGYRDDMTNVVLVLTDGRNDYRRGLTEDALLRALRKENDKARPVQVVGLAFGPDTDLASLRRIAAATGGLAQQVRDPREIRELFRRSAALKICDDPARCPAG
ncbi:substrate-binding domain-containing protein [Actinomadura rubteroloni]|uniref:substrate-binding domain-containing protein n=1 Tax=Actinomadura rubteroloni TaxID=1926885 RepID=UPI00143DA35C|nr:substrate-binding domain-containing protein [Actinomadura rubteroloni]